MKRAEWIGLAVLAIGLLTAVGGLGWLILTPDPGPEFAPAEANTEVHASLLDGGITAAAVDVTTERVLVRYALPEGMEVNQSILVVLVLTAATVPDSETIVLQVYDSERPLTQVTAETSAVRAFNELEIDGVALWDSLEFRSPT